MTQDQLDGITKSRLAANIENAGRRGVQFATDVDYIAHVCAMAGLTVLPDDAADSYAAQFADRTIDQLTVELTTALATPDPVPVDPTPEVPADPLAAAKQAKVADVTRTRDALQNSTAMTPKGAVQTDLRSRDLINGACLMALLAMQAVQPFSVTWTMADNSNVAHSAAEMIAMGQAVGTHVAACHYASVQIKAQIDACTTVEAVAAIDTTAGWPT